MKNFDFDPILDVFWPFWAFQPYGAGARRLLLSASCKYCSRGIGFARGSSFSVSRRACGHHIYPFSSPGRCRIHWSNKLATQGASAQAPGLGDGHTRQIWVPGGCLPARSRGAQGAPSPRGRPPKVRGEPAKMPPKRAQIAQKCVLGPF